MSGVNEITRETLAAKEKHGDVAAFFDLDGTLVALPSLEKRFFRILRYRREIGVLNYCLWLREAVRLVPRGINPILHINKMYLRGVRVDEWSCGTDIPVCRTLEEATRKKEERNRQARMPVPRFFVEGIERVVWHAQRGHAIVLVSGTLEPLAQAAALALLVRLGVRGITAGIRVCATRLKSWDGKWTGRIVGEAMFGEEKARAVRRFAAARGMELAKCFAYGDSASDRWMLEVVGRPTAVNPSHDLARIARRNGWPVIRWVEEKDFTPRTQKAERPQSTEEIGGGVRAVRAKSGYGA